jgi:general secretion pathway protein J
MTGSKAARGFTLVELLVAITLLGLLVVMLTGGLHYGTRVITAASVVVDRSAEIGAAYGFLREALGSAQPLPSGEAAQQATIQFEGAADELAFVALAPSHLAPGGFHVLHLGLESAGRKGRLVLRWERAARGAASEPTFAPSVLLDDIDSIEFAYFGATRAGENSAWQQSWERAGDLPDLIRLRIVFGDGTPAPEFIVAPRLAQNRTLLP